MNLFLACKNFSYKIFPIFFYCIKSLNHQNFKWMVTNSSYINGIKQEEKKPEEEDDLCCRIDPKGLEKSIKHYN